MLTVPLSTGHGFQDERGRWPAKYGSWLMQDPSCTPSVLEEDIDHGPLIEREEDPHPSEDMQLWPAGRPSSVPCVPSGRRRGEKKP